MCTSCVRVEGYPFPDKTYQVETMRDVANNTEDLANNTDSEFDFMAERDSKCTTNNPLELTQSRISDSSSARGMGTRKERRGFRALVY